MTETTIQKDSERKIKHIIAIMSGKGGTGKSLITALLAVALQRQELRVGVIDGDLACPSIAYMFGIENQPLTYTDKGFEPPMSASGIKIMSMNSSSEHEGEPLLWRGPIVSSAFKQFYTEIAWGQLDYLLVDVPAGTADVPMTVLQSFPLDGVVVVSSPQMIAVKTVKRCMAMVLQLKGRVIGVVENMAYYMDSSGECHTIFGSSNSSELLSMVDSPLLAQLPLDPKLADLCDAGHIEEYRAAACATLVTNFLEILEIKL